MMKRIILMAITLLAMSYSLSGCSEPDRWHQTDPAHGEESRQEKW